MEPLFPRWTNSLARASLVVVALAGIGLPVLGMAEVRAPWMTREGRASEQPVAFDHRHHVRDDAIDCLYCHVDATRSRYAGIPSTDVCMGCHAQVWNESAMLAPVRASLAS